ncbi:MAG: T9SS type A sorting domain-containing protein, partial [Paludibacter sp.]
DVETELNGLMTYDRKIVKGSISKFFTVNQNVIYKNLYLTDVLPTSLTNARSWKYTTTQPASDWYTTTFNDMNWRTAAGGFGTLGTPGGNIRTIWNTDDIWLRQTFDIGTLTPIVLDSLVLNVHHDEGCEIYLNGVLASTLTGYTSSYMVYPISDLAKKALISNGSNTISIHCNQVYGGQYIDAGISLQSYEKLQTPLALNNPSSPNSCKVYPNPASNKLSIVRKNAQTELIGIYNLVGREVMELNKMDNLLDISSLTSGMYFIKVKTNKELETISFMKK